MGTDDSERIPLKVFIVVNGLLMGFALLMAAARVVIQLHSQRKLLPDDFVLMFACSTFIASQAFLYALKIEDVYWLRATAMPMNPQNLASILEDPETFHRRVVKFQRIENFSVALTWTSICAVKISFLLFFYQLITRLRKLILAWKVIFGITILFWAFCMGALFISCPHFSPTPTKKCPQGHRLNRSLPLLITSTVLDIMSDLLLISIPLILLWKAKIQRQQKIFFGIFLCLSVCMIMIAIVRILGFIVKYNFDMVWLFFWHQVEGAVAIIMVSVTAFRSMLGIKARKAREKKRMEKIWFSHRPKLMTRYSKKETKDEPRSQQLPSVPAASLTGMRTIINGNGIWDESKAMEMTQKSGKNWPRAVSHEHQEIEVAHISTELDILDRAKSERVADFV